jgi:hypothetical protein
MLIPVRLRCEGYGREADFSGYGFKDTKVEPARQLRLSPRVPRYMLDERAWIAMHGWRNGTGALANLNIFGNALDEPPRTGACESRCRCGHFPRRKRERLARSSECSEHSEHSRPIARSATPATKVVNHIAIAQSAAVAGQKVYLAFGASLRKMRWIAVASVGANRSCRIGATLLSEPTLFG